MPADLVSIVIPSYNAERWLAGAIDSALGQTWPSTEVIVVDDGSRDGSVAVARSFGDRVQVLTGPNQGPAAARNRGIEVARGRHVQFLDSDDLLLPRKIEACIAAIRTATDIPFARLLPFGGPTRGALSARVGGWLRGPDPVFDPTRPIETALSFEVQTNQPLFPTDRLRAIGGFRRELRWLEDIDLNLRLVLAGARYVPVDEPLVLFRDHAEPGRQRYAPGVAVGRIAGERSMIDAVREAGRWSPDIARMFADRLAYAARQAHLAGEVEAARDTFVFARSLARHPRSTRIPLYNAASELLGFERTERWLSRLR